MMSDPVKAVAWDIDGTLVDSEPLHLDVLETVCAATGIDLSGLDQGHFRGVHLRDVWTGLAQRRPPELAEAVWAEQIVDLYCARAAELQPLPGAAETMAALDAAGIAQVCVSNSGRRVVDANIAALGIARFVGFSISLDDVAAGKPDPEPYASAAARLGLQPGEMAAVEDSATGAASAGAAGLAVYGILPEGGTVPGTRATMTSLGALPGHLGLMPAEA
ncbi:HAD family phosphatase [Mangrovicoccus sp. HB161399]|uniref:HAD family hydrolase n=1 Tax=Mangrovicoccus sp. HB161399 TaxID=2720392 RepID=UPI001C130861|nr:HAD family phosphatase [Mangrovicoccus sp. HB161399]